MLNGCSLGFCYWDLPAAILLAAVGIVFVVQQRRHKKKMKELEESEQES
ncbi:MAG: hypothetical protein WCQ94_01575 [Lachnospiraceae bacterium]|jgi:cytochrome c-type biogenesis protein CcmH/NrfF|nr:hypothetical protein [Lachnospiraceae bacterium]